MPNNGFALPRSGVQLVVAQRKNFAHEKMSEKREA